MTAGGLGAIVATAPVEAALQITDWRIIFGVLAVATLLVSFILYVTVPDKGQNALRYQLAQRIWRSYSSNFQPQVLADSADHIDVSSNLFVHSKPMGWSLAPRCGRHELGRGCPYIDAYC